MNIDETFSALKARQIGAIEALCREPDLGRAAKVAGVSKATLWRWLQEEKFSKAYRAARGRLLDEALAGLESSAGDAIKTLREVMADPEATAAARVSAARTSLELLLRLRDSLQLEERLSQVEERLKALSIKTGSKTRLRITNEY